MPIKKVHIALLCAVPLEARAILRKLTGKKKSIDGITTGGLGRLKIALACSGPGMAAAASAATMLVERYSPEVIINFGISGAFHGTGLKPGHVAAATSETFAEFGADTKEEFLSAKQIGLWSLKKGSKKYFETYPLDKPYVRLAGKHVSVCGPFVTVSTVTGRRSKANSMRKRFKGVLCENMEGAAVAHVAARYSLPMVEVRGVSNMVDDRNTNTWDVPLANRNCQHSLLELLASDDLTGLF